MAQTHLQKGQKVATPDGSGLIEEITADEIKVKLEEGGEVKTYNTDQVHDDSSAG